MWSKPDIVMQKLSFVAIAALTILISACGGYKPREVQLNPIVAEALQLPADARTCLQTDTCTWQLTTQGLTVYSSKAYDADTKGFAGTTHVFIVVNGEGKITSVIPDDNAESPEFFNKLKEAAYFDRWNGLTLSEAAQKEIDAITGATYSSRGIADAIKATAEAIGK